MKPQLTGTKERPSVRKAAGAEAALSLQAELVVAIHGAFEAAVENAVREVSKLVSQATGDIYEEMRRENESLKKRLQRAEAMLDSVRKDEPGGLSALVMQIDADQPKFNRKSPNPRVGREHGGSVVGGDTPPAGRSRADQPPAPQHEDVSRQEEQTSSHDVKIQHVSDAASDPEKINGCVVSALTEETGAEMSHVCVVRLEKITPISWDLAAQDHDLPPAAGGDDGCTLEQVTVKLEAPEEERDGSACCLDSIKVEDLSVDCMSAVQSKMLEEWKPEAVDVQSQESNAALPCSTRTSQGRPPDLTTSLPPPTDLPSLSSEFPHILQLAQPAPIPETPPQVYGVHIRTSRSLSHPYTNLYTCKSCGQTFHLPSLLRRHYGQCPQKLQQYCQQPVAGSKRTRLQLYPPGCSPFRCTECNREFNRMENLKTHLRIHTGERPYRCSVCSKCFRHSGALTRHFRIHTGEKPYVCGQCGKSFRNCGGLKLHQRSHSKLLQ